MRKRDIPMFISLVLLSLISIGLVVFSIIFLNPISAGLVMISMSVFTVVMCKESNINFTTKKRKSKFLETGNMNDLDTEDLLDLFNDKRGYELMTNPHKLAELRESYKESQEQERKRKKRTENLEDLGI